MVALGLMLCLLQAVLSIELNWMGPATEQSQLNYLNDFMTKVHKEQPIRAMLIMQHSQDNECLLQQLNLLDWPVLRFTEMSGINMSTRVNRRALALVCLSKSWQLELLTALAYNFNGMREARIIIWMESYETRELLSVIAREADRHRFYNVIVLQAKPRILLHRMQPFPLASFEQPTNESSGRIFVEHWRNYQGKSAVTMPTFLPPNSFLVADRRTGKTELAGYFHTFLTHFSRTRNISLTFVAPVNESVSFLTLHNLKMIQAQKMDFTSTLYTVNIISQMSGIQQTASVGISRQVLIVPCNHDLSYDRIIEQLILKNGFFIILLYFVLSFFELLATCVYKYLRGQGFQFSLPDFLVNLRVMRGVLGLASPMGYVESASMKQFLIILAFTGLFYNSFFSANFSTLLTKHPDHKRLETFKEVADSKIPVVFDFNIKLFIDEYDEDFFKNHVPNVVFMTLKDKVDSILALNTSYAYQCPDNLWNIVTKFQKFANRESLCFARKLDFGKDVPVSAILQNNSVYGKALDNFIQNVLSSGLDIVWSKKTFDAMFINMARTLSLTPHEHGNNPVRLGQATWQCEFLLFGLALSFVVFILELCVAYWRRRTRDNC